MLNQRCVITGPNRVEIVSLPADEPLPPGGVRIRTRYSLISPGTEIAMFTGVHVGIPDPKNRFAKYPFLAGYAAVGDVLDVGTGIDGMAPGDLVFFQGQHERIATVDAAMSGVVKLPAGMNTQLAPFARLAQIAATATVVAAGGHGVTVAIAGLGLVGNLAAQIYRISGARVFAADILAARCALGRNCGLEALEVGPHDLAQRVAAAAGRDTVDICVEATGVPQLIPQCLALVRVRGKVVLLGSPRGKVEIDVYADIHHKGVSLVGAHQSIVPRATDGLPNQRALTIEMLHRINSGELVVRPLLTTIARPSELMDCYRALQTKPEETLGVLIDWWAGEGEPKAVLADQLVTCPLDAEPYTSAR